MTQSTFGSRPAPAYPPPLPPFNADVGGRDPIEHALRTQQAVHQNYTDWRAAHAPGIDPNILKDNAGMYQVSEGALALGPALDGAKAHADAAKGKVDSAVKGQRVDTSDVAAQLAADRYWQRALRTLDAITGAPKVAAAAQDLIANADDSQIPVLAEELEPYLASRNVPTGWLAGALAGRVDGLEDAQADATLAARQVAVLAHNDAGLRNSFVADTNPPVLLDPFADAITGTPYTNGEPFSPTDAE